MGRMKNAFKVMLGVAAVAVTLLTGTKEVKAEEPNWFYVELAEGCSEAKVNARGLGSEYEYTFDLNGTWQNVTNDDISLSTPSSTKVYFRPKDNEVYEKIPGGDSFVARNGLVRIGGDILTLLNQDPSQARMGDDAFQELFKGCSGIVDASQLKLPNYVTSSCYKYMFRDCTNLKSAPNLPATALAEACYYEMFYGCSSLTTVHDLPATTLAENCYNHMFGGCSALTKAPKLPATELVSGCYFYMFRGCNNLNEVHVGLTSLEGVNDTSLQEWLNAVSSSGTLYCPQSLIDEAKASGMAHDYLRYPETWALAVEKPTPEPSPTPTPKKSESAHVHNFTWQTITEPTQYADGLEGEVCSCGATRNTQPISAFGFILNDYAPSLIKAAKPGQTVTFEFGEWNSFPKEFMAKLVDKSAQNVTFVFHYNWNHVKQEITIPAGTPIDLNFDWYGPAKMAELYGAN